MKLRAIAFSFVLVVSIIGGSVALAGTVSAAPSGMVGVPADQIQDVRASNGPLDPGDLQVYTDDHASTTEVSIVTEGQANAVGSGTPLPDVANEKICQNPGEAAEKNPNADCDEGEVSLVLSDDVNHDGRTVAIESTQLEDALGTIPGFVTIRNSESGEEWQQPTTVEDGWVFIEAPHFSDNAVTWGGEVQVGDTFTDGSQVQYDISNADATSDATVNLTGKENTENESGTWGGLQDGDSASIDVAGNNPADVTVEMSGDTAAQGQMAWNFSVPNGAPVDVAVDESTGTVYGAKDNNDVQSIDESDQTEEWVYSGHSGNVYAVAVNESGGVVYSASADEEVHAIDGDPSTGGSQLWTYTQHTDNVNDVAVDESTGTIYSASTDGSVHAIDASDGSQLWTYTGHSGDVNGIAVDESSGTVYSVSTDSEVHAIDGDPSTGGSQLWTYTGHGVTVTAVAVDESTGTVYSGSNDDTVHAIDGDPSTGGNQLWTYTGHSANIEGLTVGGGVVYSSTDNNLHAVDADPSTGGSQIWNYSTSEGDFRGLAYDGTNYAVYSGIYYTEIQAISTLGSVGDPAVTIDGKTASYSGSLTEQDTHTETLADVSTGTQSVDISASEGILNLSLSWTEKTVTENPGVALNANESVSHTGTLADGETVEYTLSSSTLQEGTNTLNVSMPSLSADAPAMQVGVDYYHDAQDDQNVSYEAEKFSERYEVSKTYSSDRSNPDLTIPFADEAVAIRDAEYRVNGGDWQTSSVITLNGTTGTVSLPDVQANDSIEVRVNASKVAVSNGEINVLEPTPAGEKLDAKVEISQKSSDFAIDVSGADDNRIQYMTDASWADADPYARVYGTGSQELRAPNANAGSTVRVKDVPIWATPENDVDIVIQDAETPRIQLRPGPTEGDLVEIEYTDTVSGQAYELRDVTNDQQADVDTAESPVYFTVSDSLTTYEILETTLDGADQPPIGVSAEESGPIPEWLLLLAAVLGGIIALAFASRQIGDGDSGDGYRPSALVLVGGSILGVVAVELATAQSIVIGVANGVLFLVESLLGGVGSTASGGIASLFGAILSALTGTFGAILAALALLGGVVYVDQRTDIEVSTPIYLAVSALGLLLVFQRLSADLSNTLFGSSLGTLLIAVGLVIGMLYIDQMTDIELSLPVYVGVGGLVLLFVLESMAGGIVDALAAGLEEVGPLVWLGLIGGGAALIYLWIRAERAPDTQVTLDLGRRGN